MGPLATSSAYYEDYRHPHQPGKFIVFVWSLAATAVLFAYIVFALILYAEQRAFHRRQQEILQNWENETTRPWSLSWTRAPEERRGRRLERTPLVEHDDADYHDVDADSHDSDDSTYGGSSNTLYNSGQVHGYGTANDHPHIGQAPRYNEHEANERPQVQGDAVYMPPPYSPVSPVRSLHSPAPTYGEHPDHGDRSEVIEEAPDATTSLAEELETESDRQESSGVTANGHVIASWTAVPDCTGDENGEQAATVPNDQEGTELSGDKATSSSSSSSSSSSKNTHALDTHKMETRIKKAVRWPFSHKGDNSSGSSSSIRSPKFGTQQEETQKDLRKRSSQ